MVLKLLPESRFFFVVVVNPFHATLANRDNQFATFANMIAKLRFEDMLSTERALLSLATHGAALFQKLDHAYDGTTL